MGRRQLTQQDFLDKCAAAHGDTYDYSEAVYGTSNTKVKIMCRKHGVFEQLASNHMYGQGCPVCRYDVLSMKNRGTVEDFVARGNAVHGGKYTYSNTVYTLAYDKVSITCPVHGDFLQAPATHLEGSGCPTCANRPSVSTEEFVKRAVAVHGDKYDYSRSVYKNAKTPVLIGCPVHGDFLQQAETHTKQGSGCNKCGEGAAATKRRLTTEDFIVVATKAHNGKYTYGEVDYKESRNKVRITCPKHGVFLQKPNHHMAGFGCPKCRGIVSKAEIDIADFLRTFTTVEQSRRDIISPKELDIFLPEHNLAIEYCGMYYHSHYDAADEAKNKRKHIEKYRLCAEEGIRLITVYENEWNDHRPQVKRLLRNVIGKSRGGLMARKCEVRTVGHEPAKRFFDKYHIQGGSGSGVAYGLFHRGELVACMRFSLGVNDRGAAGANREWTLARYATRVAVAGGASRLLKAFVDVTNPPTVKSFSDNRYFSGDMYKALGFQMVGESDMDYQVWSSKIGLKPKSHYQRRKLPARQAEHGVPVDFKPDSDVRSESQVTYEMKCGRIYDCGKKKWLLTL